MILEYSEKGIVFFPDPFLVGTPGDFGLKYEDVYFEAADGVRLHGWWVPKAGAPVLVWFHGNAGNISHRLENIKLLHDRVGVQVFIFDYREYGRSQGRISREGTFLDAAAAYRYVAETRGMPPQEIILFGRSLGTALATDLAIQKPCRGLILESAFTNSSEMARMLAPFLFDWRPKVPYDNLGKIDKVKGCWPPSCSTGVPRCPMTTWEKLIKLKYRCSSSTAPTTRSSRWPWAGASLPRPTPPRIFTSSPGPTIMILMW